MTFFTGKNILVFESNEAGRHEVGPAKFALEVGAKQGMGWGMSGNSFAIPVKDPQHNWMPLERIGRYVEEFVRFARSRPDLRFYLTRIGCGLHYQDIQIAPMFAKAPGNCILPTEWSVNDTLLLDT